MGCANSKQGRQCRHCQAPYSPVHRSSSMNIEPSHRPKEHDSHHVVALKSTTLGSLKLEDPYREDVIHFEKELISDSGGSGHDQKFCNGNDDEFFRTGLVEAKTWPGMIEEKIPKPAPRTPVITPRGEPETINAWELMEGLEDVTSPVKPPGSRIRSFSFDVARSPGWDHYAPLDRSKSRLQQSMWLQMTGDDRSDTNGFVLDFGPEVISNTRKSFQELSPSHPFHIRRPSSPEKKPPDVKPEKMSGNEKVIVYFTSLRGVRRTYEECCHVRLILKGLRVRVDERDVSMHSGFKEELRELLGKQLNHGARYGLPRVFMGKNYIGGAEEIRRLHEEGKLEKLLESCERAVSDGNGCKACGDIRFVLCETCSGSCKIFCEGEEEEREQEQEEGEEDGEGELGFRRCPDCNENGLVRCPICCD